MSIYSLAGGCMDCGDNDCSGCGGEEETKIIPLSSGFVAEVDASDYKWLSQWKWYAHKSRSGYYAARRGADKKFIYMHRAILECPEGVTADHINGDGLNNKRNNLRIATYSQNNCNRGKIKRRCSSGFLGVYRNKLRNKWIAQIKINGVQKHLGSFDCEADAAKVRDLAAIKHQGEFARLNSGANHV